jgi:hypothetical protein
MNSACLRMLFWAALCCVSTGLICRSRTRAEDNPFGFPEPMHPQRPGTVMLYGSGWEVQDFVQREFLRLAGGKNARMLLLPSDSEQRRKGETLGAYEECL